MVNFRGVNMLSIGIDVSKATIDCAFIKEDKNHHHKFDNNTKGFNALLKWLKPYCNLTDSLVCMEATGIYHLSLAKFLCVLTIKTIVANPIKTHHFAKMNMARNKTDKADALLIARYSQYLVHNNTWQQNLWHPKDQCFEDLQYLVTRLEQLEEQRLSEKNRLDIANNKVIIRSIKLAIKQLEKQVEFLESNIKSLIKSNKTLSQQVELLKTINGVGNKTAWAFLAYAGDVNEFDNANQITSFAGLNPRQKQSGSSVNGSSLSKMGHRKLRKALFMPALTAIRYNPVLKVFYERLLARGKAKMLAIAAVMRKLLVLMFGVLKSGVVFDVDYRK